MKKVSRLLRRTYLRLRIWEAEGYKELLYKDGIVQGMYMREFCHDLEEMRCELALLESEGSSPPWQWHDLVLAAILVAAILAAVFLSHHLPGGT